MGCQPGDNRWPLQSSSEFVWVCMGKNTHFITLEDTTDKEKYRNLTFTHISILL